MLNMWMERKQSDSGKKSANQNRAEQSVRLSLFLIGRRNRRARRETVQGAAGQAGDDVRVADWEGEVGVSIIGDAHG